MRSTYTRNEDADGRQLTPGTFRPLHPIQPSARVRSSWAPHTSTPVHRAWPGAGPRRGLTSPSMHLVPPAVSEQHVDSDLQ